MPTSNGLINVTQLVRLTRLAGLTRLVLALGALTSAMLLAGCERCSFVRPLAKLEIAHGSVVRDHADQQQVWQPASPGAELRMGDAIKTEAHADAELELDDNSRLRMESDTLIRFMDKRPGDGEQNLDLVTGSASIAAGDQGTAIRTGFGLARLEQGSRLALVRRGEKMEVQVLVGLAHLESENGERFDLANGQKLLVSVGTAQIELDQPEKAVEPEPAPTEPTLETTFAGEWGADIRPDIDVGAGQSLVVHDPSPPLSVRIVFRSACAKAEVKLSGAPGAVGSVVSGRGEGAARFRIGPGKVSYAVQCLDGDNKPLGSGPSGSLFVLRDAGTKPVPAEAPSTRVDVNGRAYTVLYQNLLPRVTVAWANPPPELQSATVRLSGGGSSRSFTARGPTYTFPAGLLGEGTHTVYFEGADRVSRRTSITISFDNATPAAALQTPAETGLGPGSPLPISGTALPGWMVTVDGRTIAPDANGRFSTQGALPASGRPLVVYLSHPKRGTHAYLRRPVGSR